MNYRIFSDSYDDRPGDDFNWEEHYEESPEEIWDQYMKWFRRHIQENYKNTDYIKTLDTQYLGYKVL